MAAPTAEEQLMLELINRLRMDPDGEYARLIDPDVLAQIQNALNFFGVDLSSFEAAMLTYDAVAPLAWNENLAQAALTHNNLMISEDKQSHQLPGEAGLGARISAAGYTGWSNLGENIYAFSNTVLYGHAGFVIDWGFDDEDFDSNGQRYADWQTRGDGIQDPAGHLNSLMNGVFTEVGIAIAVETDPTTDVGPYVITQDFGNRWSYSAQFVGVVIDDADNDDFYDIGEGMGGVTVTLEGTGGEGTFTTTTWGSGGWQIDVPSGTYDISFTGGALIGDIQVTATLGSANVKVDVEADDAVVSGNVQNGTGIGETLTGSGAEDVLNGLGGNDMLFGLGGNDTLDGGTGDDTYIFDSLGDIATELAGEGRDKVRTNVKINTAVAGFENIEEFELYGDEDTLLGNDFDTTLIANANLGSKIFANGGVDTLIGSGLNDKLYGGAGTDTLNGFDGNDRLDGGTEADDMIGGDGDDRYFVDDLGDTVTEMSGEGTDQVRSSVDWTLGDNVENLRLRGSADSGIGNALDNVIQAVAAGTFLSGLGGDDNLRGSNGADTILGGGDNDTINGRSGNDDLRGGTGDDYIQGRSGEDHLQGGSGDDELNGGKDDDIIEGGADQDIMTGEGGADTFKFSDGDFAGLDMMTADQITDFDQAENDLIDLADVDAILGGGDDAFTFINDAAFSGTAGELRWEHDGGNTMIYMDVDGDAQADYAIRLDGNLSLLEANFIL